jgi:hypothetical protein
MAIDALSLGGNQVDDRELVVTPEVAESVFQEVLATDADDFRRAGQSVMRDLHPALSEYFTNLFVGSHKGKGEDCAYRRLIGALFAYRLMREAADSCGRVLPPLEAATVQRRSSAMLQHAVTDHPVWGVPELPVDPEAIFAPEQQGLRLAYGYLTHEYSREGFVIMIHLLFGDGEETISLAESA